VTGRPTQARRAAHAEWTKLRTLPATPWLLVGLVAGMVGAGALQAATVDTADCPTPSTCYEDTTALALGGVALGQAAVVVLAVTAVTTEHATGTIKATLAAVPRRGTVLAAKASVVTALVVPVATLATGLSLGGDGLCSRGPGHRRPHLPPPRRLTRARSAPTAAVRWRAWCRSTRSAGSPRGSPR
jgi:hypothetical protein